MVDRDRLPGAALLRRAAFATAIGATSAASAARRVVAALLAATVAILPLAGCATNPVSGKREFSLVTPEQELKMGAEGNKAVLEEYGAYDDKALAAYVDSVGQALAKVSHLPGLTWHFTVIDDPAVNAFALPGGYIYITRGILAHLNSEAQLAGVMGHEIGHVTARHSARRETQQEVAGVGLAVAGIFSSGFRQYSQEAQQALGLMMLKYSRDDETQADALGVQYSTKAGWDSREIPATYHMLQRVSERSGQRLPTFLATHPDPGQREITTRNLAQQATAGKAGLIVHGASYVRHLEGVIYDADPRQGYFEGDLLYVPDVDLQMRLPTGWKQQNSRSAVMAMQPNERAAMQLTLVNSGGLGPGEYVARLQADGKILGAQGGGESIGGSPAWAGRFTIQNSDGSQGTMIAIFVERSKSQMFQILGRSSTPGDEDDAAIFASARSIRTIQDAAKRSPAVAHVHLVAIASAGTFEVAVARLGPQAIDAEETSILNNIDPGENVFRGQTLKIVKR